MTNHKWTPASPASPCHQDHLQIKIIHHRQGLTSARHVTASLTGHGTVSRTVLAATPSQEAASLPPLPPSGLSLTCQPNKSSLPCWVTLPTDTCLLSILILTFASNYDQALPITSLLNLFCFLFFLWGCWMLACLYTDMTGHCLLNSFPLICQAWHCLQLPPQGSMPSGNPIVLIFQMLNTVLWKIRLQPCRQLLLSPRASLPYTCLLHSTVSGWYLHRSC